MKAKLYNSTCFCSVILFHLCISDEELTQTLERPDFCFDNLNFFLQNKVKQKQEEEEVR